MGILKDVVEKVAAGAVADSPQVEAISSTPTPVGGILRALGIGKKKGGVVKSNASKRADGCAMRGKTKGRIV